MEGIHVFGAVDYIVFILMLLISALIGIYFQFTGGQQKTYKEFNFANNSMSPFPVSFSLMASFMSAITILGVSGENYAYGTQFMIINIGYVIGTPIVMFVFLPVFYQTKVKTAFEYLEIRFQKSVRMIASLVFVLQMVLYMSIVLYAPALALSAVTGFDKWIAIITLGLVCTFYCAIGGIKAVLWTDVFQSLLMYISMLMVIVKGTIDVGGLQEVWDIAEEGGRIQFTNFDPNPMSRHTVWSLIIGGMFVYISLYGANQIQIQRLLTVKSLKAAKWALLMACPLTMFLSLTTSFAGLVIYANLKNCDPLLQPNITHVYSRDQILPYYVVRNLSSIPGLPGLFVAGIYGAALSTMSSAINSLSCVTVEEYLKPNCPFLNSEGRMAKATKVLAIMYGLICLALTVVAENLGGVLQASLAIFGIVGGPLFGLFCLGMLTSSANSKGAIIGMLFSLILVMWIGFGGAFKGYSEPFLPLQNTNCSGYSLDPNTFSQKNDQDVFPLYKLSYMWLSTIGTIAAFIVGLITSYLTGPSKDIKLNLLSPVVQYFIKRDLRRQYQSTEDDPPVGSIILQEISSNQKL